MISVEVFAAKDSTGALKGVLLSVPVDCGLKHADTLRIHGSRLLAMEQQSILPIDMPAFDDACLQDLVETARRHGLIAVGEFTALGLGDSYLLTLEVGPTTSGGGARKGS
jgi:hypothetical protein